jgi:hypothetical protein
MKNTYNKDTQIAGLNIVIGPLQILCSLILIQIWKVFQPNLFEGFLGGFDQAVYIFGITAFIGLIVLSATLKSGLKTYRKSNGKLVLLANVIGILYFLFFALQIIYILLALFYKP